MADDLQTEQPVRLTFLGSRGNHPATSSRHLRHSALLVESGGLRLMLDCGSDWKDHVLAIAPDAIILTHAHADHAGGIGPEIECPILATAATWDILNLTDIRNKRIFAPGQALTFGEVSLVPFSIGHSLRAPAIALRVESDDGTVLYAPDIATLQTPEMLRGCSLYIGDGSTWDSLLLRTERGESCGHAPIPQQLAWCQQAGVAEVIFTHCGAQVVADTVAYQARLSTSAQATGIRASFAQDGLVRELSAL